MQANKVRNLLGLAFVAATATGAYFNHNYYYYGYQGDRIWEVKPSAKKEYRKLDREPVNKSEGSS